MSDPITAALILGLAVQKFAEGAAGKSAEKLIERLWDTIATRFKGRKKVEEAIEQVEASKGQAPEAIAKLEKVLDGEFVEDEDFEAELVTIVREIERVEPKRVQTMLVGIKTAKGIKVEKARQKSTEATEQLMASDIEAESLEFVELTQEQG